MTGKGIHSVDTPGEGFGTTDTPTLRPDSGESTPITSLFGEPIDWAARLEQAVADTLAARTRRRNERAQLARRRTRGLEQRHTAKLARTPRQENNQ